MVKYGWSFFFIVFFGLIQASEALELSSLTVTLNELLRLVAGILFGLLILFVGNIVSKNSWVL